MAVFRKLFSYGGEKKGFMAAAMILSGVATILSFLPYYFFWQILSEMTGSADVGTVKHIAIMMMIATLLYGLTYFFALICSHVFAFRIETNLKKAGLRHLLDAGFSFFDVNTSGRTRKIIDDNSANTHTIVAHVLPDTVNAILFPICLIALAFYAGYEIGILVILAIVAAMICFKFMYGGSSEAMMREYMEALEDINSQTVEYVRGIQVIKIFDTVIESFEKLYQAITKYSEVVNKQCKTCKIPFIMFQCIMMNFAAFMIPIAVKRIDGGAETGAVITLVVFVMAFAGLLFNAFVKIMFFQKNFSLANDTLTKLEGVFESMDKDKLSTGSLTEMDNNDIEFRNVTFGYEECSNVLENFSLKLPGNRRYALVGSSGGGKSTIAKLISGFYPVRGGSLRIGGHDITEYTSGTLERNIAFIFQDSKLFKMSIYDNVQIGDPNKSREEVMKALEAAQCSDILDKFETREDTMIGAKGVHLSGGEVQRIAIARAILKDSPIVILDEASAANDPDNEYELQRAFTELMKGKTVIMIAHRLSGIHDVDEILFIEDGKAIERGTHAELMAEGGRYKRFQDLFKQASEWRVAR